MRLTDAKLGLIATTAAIGLGVPLWRRCDPPGGPTKNMLVVLAAIALRTVALQTPVLERQLDYYRRVMGHAVVDQTRNQAVLATKIAEVAVILKSGDVFRCEGCLSRSGPIN